MPNSAPYGGFSKRDEEGCDETRHYLDGRDCCLVQFDGIACARRTTRKRSCR